MSLFLQPPHHTSFSPPPTPNPVHHPYPKYIPLCSKEYTGRQSCRGKKHTYFMRYGSLAITLKQNTRKRLLWRQFYWKWSQKPEWGRTGGWNSEGSFVSFLNKNKGMFLQFGGTSWGAYIEMQLKTFLWNENWETYLSSITHWSM